MFQSLKSKGYYVNLTREEKNTYIDDRRQDNKCDLKSEKSRRLYAITWESSMIGELLTLGRSGKFI